MTMIKRVEVRERFMARLNKDADLLEEITGICRKHGITLGRIEALGAVQKACFSFYDQGTHEYMPVSVNKPLEILKLTGNVSLRDNAPFVHAHVTLGDSEGRAYGGHLAPGTVIFACECMVEALDGPALSRQLDQATGLFLWAE
ncbi:MAG TPA: PPC domain-containing DNA-binding protein [Syntrophorhabdales bacterium]|nr:PPC domain-containing DNA-binding protein [Syntrophorhabdales bacterium]